MKTSVQRIAVALLVTAHAGDGVASDTALAARLVERAEAEEDADTRAELLERAIRTAPDHAPARWAAGQVRTEAGWMAVSAAQSHAAADARLAEYQRRCDAVETADGHAALAKWCERNRLPDEARLHWLIVLDDRPDSPEALRALDLVRRGDRLVSREVARSAESLQRESERVSRSWARRIARWEKSRPSRGDRDDPVLNEVREIDDEHAAPAFERMSAALANPTDPRSGRRQQLLDAYVESLARGEEPWATRVLVRLAVLSPHEANRRRATDALVEKPEIEIVPPLLISLRPLVESAYAVRVAANGDVSYTHNVTIKGYEADSELRRGREGRIAEVDPTVAAGRRFDRVFDPSRASASVLQRRIASLGFQLDYYDQAREIETSVAVENTSASDWNRRVTGVLKAVTGQDLGEDPTEWWGYWSRYQGFEPYEERQVTRYYDFDTSNRFVVSPYALQPRRCECFVAGTPVWTKTGRKPIETVQAGDFVLAKDTETGELAFRAVLATTIRQPSPMLRVEVGPETIVSTVGHPFWVLGQGWRMAKRLAVGDRVATVEGPATIEAVASTEDAEAYNLVVEGFGDYFVGESGVLVHDNTPRGRAAALARR